jgi:hypothetical protein
MRIVTRTGLAGLGLAVLLALGVAARGEAGDGAAPQGTLQDTFATSLHATGNGMEYWYLRDNGGFEQYTNVAYDELSCRNCHTPATCTNCHETDGAPVPQATCLGCHSRQNVEINGARYSDVHRDAGMECTGCHSALEVHGDGTEHRTMFDRGAMDTRCENCHASTPSNAYHAAHGADIDCAVCHMQGVVTCNNCHFELEIEQGVKRAAAQFGNWTFLINYDGKVHAANYQSVKYGGHTFVAIAPYYAHSIARNAVTCASCHAAAAVQEYAASGAIQVVGWDANTASFTRPTGIVPVPPDYETALRFDFVTWNGTAWEFLEEGPDAFQMLFGTPLTAEQMDALISVTP